MCVVSSLQSKLVAKAAKDPDHALQHLYDQKWRKYGDACQAKGIIFQPMPIEMLGGWHEAGAKVVKRIGQALARTTGQVESVVVKHLFERLSLLLVRGNYQLVTNRFPHPEPQIDGTQYFFL